MEFKVDKNPYDRKLFTNETLVLEPNSISCLVGCNGTGKTTVIRYVEKRLKELHAEEFEESPYSGLANALRAERPENKKNLYFVNFSKHTENAKSEEDMFFLRANVSFSSTGEGVSYRLGKMLKMLGASVNKIKDKNASIFIFFDDCDAGTSLDKIVEIKDVFNLISKDCAKNGITYYIVITANSYEMCRDLDCISVHDFKHITFTDYEDYKRFVLESAVNKERSYEEAEKNDK